MALYKFWMALFRNIARIRYQGLLWVCGLLGSMGRFFEQSLLLTFQELPELLAAAESVSVEQVFNHGVRCFALFERRGYFNGLTCYLICTVEQEHCVEQVALFTYGRAIEFTLYDGRSIGKLKRNGKNEWRDQLSKTEQDALNRFMEQLRALCKVSDEEVH